MPQFDAATFPSQLFWLLVCFFILLVFSTKVTLPRLGEIFLLRWKKIEGTMKEADNLNQSANDLVLSYESELKRAKKQAHDMVLGTSRQAAADFSRKKAELALTHKKRFRDAELLIAKKKADAMGDVQVVAHTLAKDLLGALDQKGFGVGTVEAAVSVGMAKRVTDDYQ